MSTEAGHPGIAPNGLDGQQPSAVNPCIEITPNPRQYDQLCRDLGALRRAGAASNTAAVIAAVQAAAAGKLEGG